MAIGSLFTQNRVDDVLSSIVQNNELQLSPWQFLVCK